MQELEQIVSGAKHLVQTSSSATPFPHLQNIVDRAVKWVDKQSRFLWEFDEGDQELANYDMINFADRKGSFKLVKALTFA